MLHRRLLHDDSLGVGEPINETAFGQGLVIHGSHYLLLEPPQSSALYHRSTAQRLFMSPISTYALTMNNQSYKSLMSPFFRFF
jgi:lysosomal alpha-mannosidase